MLVWPAHWPSFWQAHLCPRPEFHADADNYDGWREAQGGFRADWSLANSRTLTPQGNAYDGRLGERPTLASYTSPFASSLDLSAPISGGNVLARFGNRATAASSYQVQAYYDRTNRDELPVAEDRDTVDVDFQNTLRWWSRNTLSWGAGYRLTAGRILAVAPTAFLPPDRAEHLYTAFAQDEFELVPARWRMPAMDGFAVLKGIRALENGREPRLPVIAVTAYASDECRDRCRRAGFQAHIAKPYDTAEMIRTIMLVLARV